MTAKSIHLQASMKNWDEFISFIERGKNGPSLEGIKRLARALAVTEADLFNFTEESMR